MGPGAAAARSPVRKLKGNTKREKRNYGNKSKMTQQQPGNNQEGFTPSTFTHSSVFIHSAAFILPSTFIHYSAFIHSSIFINTHTLSLSLSLSFALCLTPGPLNASLCLQAPHSVTQRLLVIGSFCNSCGSVGVGRRGGTSVLPAGH